MSIEEVKRLVVPILKKHGVTKAGIFGSLARGEAGWDSDIDILVRIEQNISLLDFIGLKQKIEDALGQKVDLVEYEAIKPLIRERVLREQVTII